jgi:STE24 endopeptidase
MSFNFRQYVLTLCVPMGIILAVMDLARLAFGERAEESWVYAAVMLPILAAGYTLAPMVLVRVWKTSRLPESDVRERLVRLCGRIGVACREIMIWETPGLQFLNAAVMGVVGRFRYIVVSRTLIEMLPPDNIEAVFAHELGHARRHHMVYYLLFVVNCLLLANLVEGLSLAKALWNEDVYLAAAAVTMLAGIGLGFGALSRTFEREADLFGADTVGNAETFASALQAIAYLNSTNPSSRSWRHGSIASRVEFLRAAAAPDSPARAAFLARVEFTKVFLASLCAAALAAFALLAGLA